MANDLFPKKIEVDSESIKKLHGMFAFATADIHNHLQALKTNQSRGTVMQVRQQTHQRIQSLANEVGTWIATTVPYAYAEGQHDAARQQNHFGDKVAAGVIAAAIVHHHFANKPISVSIPVHLTSAKPADFDLHNQATENIMNDMRDSFGNSLTSMSRSTDGIISRVQALGLRKAIAEGAANGSSVSDISKAVADLIDKANIYGLVDKAGREWAPDVYAEMLVRTKLVEARNNGLMNSLLSAGKSLVQVSAHGAIDQCGPWENRILSVTGTSSSYPSVSDAYAGGLFHPNCEHSLNAVDESILPKDPMALATANSA